MPLAQRLTDAGRKWFGRLSAITQAARGRYRGARPV